MSIAVSQLIGEVRIDGSDKAKYDLLSVGDSVNQTGGFLKNALGGALGFAANMAGAALGFLKDQMVDSVKLAMSHEQVMAQTAQAIKSTGGVAGETASAIDGLADSLSKTTDFTHDTVQAGENLLLTFTSIGKNVFPETTQAMLDLSQATGQDMKSSAIQLGKALNDPTTGLTALARVGVSFSTQEKEQIKTMMAHNDIMGAQKVMLKELETEFGGSAQAAGRTFAGQVQILSNTFEDFKVKIGTAILPILSQLMTWGMQAFDALGKGGEYVWNVLRTINLSPLMGAWQEFSGAVGQLWQAFQKLAEAINPVQGDFDPLAETIGNLAKGGLSILVGLLHGLATAFSSISQQIQTGRGPLIDIWNVFVGLGNAVSSIFHALAPVFAEIGGIIISQLAPAWKQLQQAIEPALPALKTIGEFIGGVLVVGIGLAIGLITGLAMGIARAISGIVTVITGLITIFTGVFNVIAGIINFFVDLFTGRFDKLSGDLGQIMTGIGQMFVGLWTTVAGVFETAFGFISGLVEGFAKGVYGFFKGLYDDLVGHSLIPDLIGEVTSWLAKLPGEALHWASDMCAQFIAGIEQGLADIGNAASKIAGVISSHLHFSKPDIGPLADADTWMPDFMDMLSSGINGNLGKIQGASFNVAASISGGNSSLQGVVPTSVSQGVGASQIVVQPAPVMLDGRTLMNGLFPYFADAVRSNTGVRF